jgi:hypothetical protein
MTWSPTGSPSRAVPTGTCPRVGTIPNDGRSPNTRSNPPGCGLSAVQRGVIEGHHRVDGGVEPLEVMGQQLMAADLPAALRRGELDRGAQRELGVGANHVGSSVARAVA